jgi:hypothetical protein
MLSWLCLSQQLFKVCVCQLHAGAFDSPGVPLCAFDQALMICCPSVFCRCLSFQRTQVVVYHRKAGMPRRSYGSDDKFSAPLLMWMPLDQTYDPELHVVPSNAAAKQQLAGSSSSKFADVGSPTNSSSKDVEYIVTEDAPIWQHVRRMLRPFLAVPALRQQPPAADEAAGVGEAMQQDDEQQQQQTGLGSAGAGADVSMAAASAVPGSPAASPSPEPCCTSRPADAAVAAAPATAGAGVKAASEAGEGNSTWGSHGSDSPRSDVDMTGLDEAAAAVAAGIADDEVAAAAGSAGAVPDVSSPQQQQQSDGEEDASAATAALAIQELGGGSSAEDATAAAAAAAAAAAGSSGLLGHGGVPVQPLDIWSAQPQVRCCDHMLRSGLWLFHASTAWRDALRIVVGQGLGICHAGCASWTCCVSRLCSALGSSHLLIYKPVCILLTGCCHYSS